MTSDNYEENSKSLLTTRAMILQFSHSPLWTKSPPVTLSAFSTRLIIPMDDHVCLTLIFELKRWMVQGICRDLGMSHGFP